MDFRPTRFLAPALLLTAICCVTPNAAPAQQVESVDHIPVVSDPAFALGTGPVVLMDEAHNNFHTSDGRFLSFSELLRRDGYQVTGLDTTFSESSLQGADIVVIANALAAVNVENWSLPTPSAFTDPEIDVLMSWLHAGGALLLIADHMPFPGAVAPLAERLGIVMANGFVFAAEGTGTITFDADVGTLADHPIRRGRSSAETVKQVTTFMGQAFWGQPDIVLWPLLILAPQAVLLLPAQAWQFSDLTPRRDASGLYQGAALRSGEGRVAIFAEAAMFTVQVISVQREAGGAQQPWPVHNAQYALNVLHWLSGLLEPEPAERQ